MFSLESTAQFGGDMPVAEWHNVSFNRQMVEIGLFLLKRQRLRRNRAQDLNYLEQQFWRNLNLFHLNLKTSSYARNCLDKAASVQEFLRTLLYWIPHQLLDVHNFVTTSHPLGGEPKYFLQFLDSFRVETCWLFLSLHRMWCLVLINNAFLFSRTLPASF